jgi:hypothetical protein
VSWWKKDWSDRHEKNQTARWSTTTTRFTFNIVQYFGELGADVEVFRNDEITLEGIAAQSTRPLGHFTRALFTR